MCLPLHHLHLLEVCFRQVSDYTYFVQRLQLNVFLESLHDSRHVAMLLGPLYKASEQSSEESSAQLAANLMKTVLGNLCSDTVSCRQTAGWYAHPSALCNCLSLCRRRLFRNLWMTQRKMT